MTGSTPLERTKQLLASPVTRIELDDHVTAILRTTFDAVSTKRFSVSGTEGELDFAARVAAYDAAVAELRDTVILLARWADRDGIILLEKIFASLADRANRDQSGTVVWIRLASYPVASLLYSAGIAALSAKRYDVLPAVLAAPFWPSEGPQRLGEEHVVTIIFGALRQIDEHFKLIRGHDRQHVPRSEYLYQQLKPVLETLLFLGNGFDALFDRFELFLALTFADLRAKKDDDHIWGPPGRFYWKHQRSEGPLVQLINEAATAGNAWPPLGAGFFRGDSKRFKHVAEAFKTHLDRSPAW